VRLRIAVVAPCGYPTTQGSQVYIRGTSRALQDRGHDVRVVTYHYGQEGVTSHGVPLRRIRGLNGYRKLRAGPSIHKPALDAQLAALTACVVRREAIDVIHAHNIEAPFVALLARARCGVPVVQHVHMLAAEELPTYGVRPPRVAAWLGRRIDRAVPRLVDSIIVLSARARCAFGSVRPVHVIPPGIDPRDFDGPQGGIPEPVVAYAGNPDAYQEPDILLSAFERLLQQCPDARLRLISGSSMADWVARGERLGVPSDRMETVFAPTWEATREALRTASLGVVPRTQCAGFPIKLLNYMGLGLPVVASRGSAGPLRHETDGLVVPDGDPIGFASAMARLLDDPDERARMGRAAATSVRQDHTWDRRSAAYDAVHEELLVGRA
jgi:glycosyltransferase involved in cell wall biosynthesis